MERRHLPALTVRLRIPGRHAEPPGERREPVVVIERPVLLAIHDHMLDRHPARSRSRGPRAGPREQGNGYPCGHSETGTLEERSPVRARRPKAGYGVENPLCFASASHAALQSCPGLTRSRSASIFPLIDRPVTRR